MTHAEKTLVKRGRPRIFSDEERIQRAKDARYEICSCGKRKSKKSELCFECRYNKKRGNGEQVIAMTKECIPRDIIAKICGISDSAVAWRVSKYRKYSPEYLAALEKRIKDS